MASPELAIAKATLSATLFRADPKSIPRPTVEVFFPNLTAAVTQCSRPNVQKCRAWIVEHVVNSKARSTALGKYLLALTKSFSPADGEKPSLKRQRLHLLYVLNDVLHHTVVKAGNRTFEEAIAPVLPALIAQAASFKSCPKHDTKLKNVVALWTEKQYFASSLDPKLKAALSGTLEESGEGLEEATVTSTIKIAKEVPYTLPSYHGDASTPWFDLPATTWLPHLTPNSTTPMRTEMIQPIRLAGGPASQSLINAVQGLLNDVDRLYSKRGEAAAEDEDQRLEINELGERILLDEITGDIVGGETYYGWSRQFCEKMKERKRAAKAGKSRGRSRSLTRSNRSDSRSRSRSGSARGFKRRRSSSAASERGFRQRSFSRGRRENSHQRRDYSPSRSRSRSGSPPRGFQQRRPSPPSASAYPQPPQQPLNHFVPPPPPQQGFPQTPFPPGQFPPPPPRPAGYQGPWPPPPPMPFDGRPPPNWLPPSNVGGWTPAPPQHQQQQSPYGQYQQTQYNDYKKGGHEHNGRGREGYHRGGRGGY